MNVEPAASDARLSPYRWHQPSWLKLLELQQRQRLPHALLLSGVRGTGKLHFAQAFARLLLCSKPGATACGHCKGCLLNQQGSHPDLVQISPEEAGKAIKIDQIRNLNRFIGGAAQQGGYRVVVITPPEEMNVNAANALLKGLEEPGDKTLFLLVSDNPGRLMATIRSRCQGMTLPSPSHQQALDWLSEASPQADGELLLRLSGGAPLMALEFEQNQSLARRTLLLKGLQEAASRRLPVPEVAQQLYKEEPLQLLAWLSSLINDLVRYRACQSSERLVNVDAVTLIEKASARATDEKLFAFIDKIQEYRLQIIAKTNPNRQLMFEDLLIGWVALLRK